MNPAAYQGVWDLKEGKGIQGGKGGDQTCMSNMS